MLSLKFFTEQNRFKQHKTVVKHLCITVDDVWYIKVGQVLPKM